METPTNPAGFSRIHKLLMAFVGITIIGDLLTVVIWVTNPDSQLSLQPSMLGNAIGNAGTTLAVGSALTVAIAVAYIVSLYGLMKNLKWAPLLVAAISIVNRVMALFIFIINPSYVVFLVWTIILVVFSYLDMRRPPSPTPLAASV